MNNKPRWLKPVTSRAYSQKPRAVETARHDGDPHWQRAKWSGWQLPAPKGRNPRATNSCSICHPFQKEEDPWNCHPFQCLAREWRSKTKRYTWRFSVQTWWRGLGVQRCGLHRRPRHRQEKAKTPIPRTLIPNQLRKNETRKPNFSIPDSRIDRVGERQKNGKGKDLAWSTILTDFLKTVFTANRIYFFTVSRFFILKTPCALSIKAFMLLRSNLKP